MKLSIVSIIVSLALVSQVAATPSALERRQCVDPPTYHCGGPDNLTCPCGYRCCGPLIVGIGGTCYMGTTGVCPL